MTTPNRVFFIDTPLPRQQSLPVKMLEPRKRQYTHIDKMNSLPQKLERIQEGLPDDVYPWKASDGSSSEYTYSSKLKKYTERDTLPDFLRRAELVDAEAYMNKNVQPVKKVTLQTLPEPITRKKRKFTVKLKYLDPFAIEEHFRKTFKVTAEDVSLLQEIFIGLARIQPEIRLSNAELIVYGKDPEKSVIFQSGNRRHRYLVIWTGTGVKFIERKKQSTNSFELPAHYLFNALFTIFMLLIFYLIAHHSLKVLQFMLHTQGLSLRLNTTGEITAHYMFE